jgi:hypothetical protein
LQPQGWFARVFWCFTMFWGADHLEDAGDHLLLTCRQGKVCSCWFGGAAS